jgi:hypothetical protein
MDNKESFLAQIKKNLENNGYPQKKVSFDVEKMYELADNKGLSFNTVLRDLKEIGIDSNITTEKVIFSPVEAQIDQADMMAQAQEMLSKMDPEEIKKIKDMYENMSESEKETMMKQAKDMGMK